LSAGGRYQGQLPQLDQVG